MAEEQAVPVVAKPADQPAEPLVYLKLESREKDIVEISELAAQQSIKISKLIDSRPIPFDNISTVTLKKIVEWCEHHRGEEVPPEDESLPKQIDVPKWDQEFLEIDNELLSDLIFAVDYLEIRTLMNYACKRVANMGKGKSPEEMRTVYFIPTDQEDEQNAKKSMQPN